jgi:hypothetical protein
MANYGRRFPLLSASDACRSIFGVYLLYHDGNHDRPIVIGKGNIRHHLQALANDPEVAAFSLLDYFEQLGLRFRGNMSRE